jgi:hypothetical protein
VENDLHALLEAERFPDFDLVIPIIASCGIKTLVQLKGIHAWDRELVDDLFREVSDGKLFTRYHMLQLRHLAKKSADGTPN